MIQSQRRSSQDFIPYTTRKRVGKACDRCQLKKNKCEGISQCSRCKADNAVCTFGGRKRSSDKVYPKGYAEALERQHGQLVAGLQDLYNRLLVADAWQGKALPKSSGQPLTHDILAGLDLLGNKVDSRKKQELLRTDTQKKELPLMLTGDQAAGGTGATSNMCAAAQDLSRLECHDLQPLTISAGPEEVSVWHSSKQLLNMERALEGHQSTDTSLQTPQEGLSMPSEDFLLFSATWRHDENPFDKSLQWYTVPESSDFDCCGYQTGPMLTMEPVSGGPEFDMATADANLEESTEVSPWTVEEQIVDSFDGFQTVFDIDFSQYIFVAS